MSFPDLQDFVQQQFSAFSGADEYERQLSIWCVVKRVAASDRAKAWRKANPERARASQRERNRRWRAAHAKPRQQKPRTDRKAYQHAYYEANRERLKAAARARRSPQT